MWRISVSFIWLECESEKKEGKNDAHDVAQTVQKRPQLVGYPQQNKKGKGGEGTVPTWPEQPGPGEIKTRVSHSHTEPRKKKGYVPFRSTRMPCGRSCLEKRSSCHHIRKDAGARFAALC